jgi:hypothetical protein
LEVRKASAWSWEGVSLEVRKASAWGLEVGSRCKGWQLSSGKLENRVLPEWRFEVFEGVYFCPFPRGTC